MDWDFIFTVNLDELNDEKAELLYDQLIEFVPDSEDDVKRLRRVFTASKCVMQVKALQADVAIEELEEMAKKKGDKNEIETLRDELEFYKKNLNTGTSGVDMASKMRDYHQEINSLKEAIESKESDLSKSKRKISELERKAEIRNKEVETLRNEVDSLKEEIDSQRHGLDDQIFESQEPIEKLREKNKQIQTLLDEIKDMEAANYDLARHVKTLKDELRTATEDIKMSTLEMESMRSQMKELHEFNETLVKEKEYSIKETDELRLNLKKFEDEDDLIASKFSEKIDRLIHLIRLKDEEIQSMKSKLKQRDERLQENSKNDLIKEIESKDEQVRLLRTQLQDAVKDIESQNQLMEKIVHNSKEDTSKTEDEDDQSLVEIKLKYEEKLSKLEEENQTKDEELMEVIKRNNLYEKSQYGLTEALAEIKMAQKEVDMKNKRIEELVQQLNKLNEQLNDATDELIYVKDCAKWKDELNDDPEDKSVTKSLRNDKIKILKLQKQIVKLEDDKIMLHEELRKIRNENKLTNFKGKLDPTQNQLAEDLKSLENENRELQLGMKEILIGLKESDAKSDVVIECPSLERLCQLLESRSLSSDLTNVIALKAELDLIRGHNEQLRMELKHFRYEHLKLINQYTMDVLGEFSYKEVDDKLEASESESKEKLLSDGEVFKSNTEVDVSEDPTISAEDEDITEKIDEADRSYDNVVRKKSLTIPLVVQRSIHTQTVNTDNVVDSNSSKEAIPGISLTKFEFQSISTQTEFSHSPPNQVENVQELAESNKICNNCIRVNKAFDSLKGSMDRIEISFKSNEDNYIQHLKILQDESERLKSEFKNNLETKDNIIAKKDVDIKTLTEELTTIKQSVNPNVQNPSEDKEVAVALVEEQDQAPHIKCTSILQTIINCLQARLDHKDESIRQYQRLLHETQRNFELEIEKINISMEQRERQESERAVKFKETIDNEELQGALEKCLEELERCKIDSNKKAEELEAKIESKSMDLKMAQEENERLKIKSSTHQLLHLKKDCDRLKDELEEKSKMIEKLQKTLKDERTMRSVTPLKIKKVKKEKKDDEDDHEDIIANCKTQLEDLRKELDSKIKVLEITKWDAEKRMKDTTEMFKTKTKEKNEEISRLEKSIEKVKLLLEKSEKERMNLETRLNKKINQKIGIKEVPTLFKSTQTDENLIKELKKLEANKLSLKKQIDCFKDEIQKRKEIEEELKIILQESLQREKLTTICEEEVDTSDQVKRLLKENAQLKIELRMTEFELNAKKVS